MDSINDVIRLIKKSIDACTDYVKENAFKLAVLLAIAYYIRNNILPNRLNPAKRLSNDSKANSSSKNRKEELRLVRERQQQIANERAKQADILRKEKEKKEKERKNNVAKEKKKKTQGDRLGGTNAFDGSSCTYNPLQPWSSNSTGYRYVLLFFS
jgi:hypothetical protein